MTDLENTTQPAANPTPSESSLQSELRSLRSQFTSLLIILLVFSGSLDVFILRQLMLIGRQSKELNAIVADYEQGRRPIMENFTERLRDYAKSHREFVPILTKHGALQEVPATNPPGAKPAPKK
jgi:hypothetical protein